MLVKNVKTNITNIILSILSSIPPCPGIILEKSLILYALLIAEKNKSPILPTILKKSVIKVIWYILIVLDITVIKNIVPINVPTIVPPINPSIVFLGDISSNSLCLPIKLPIIYAYVSVATVIESKYTITLSPKFLYSVKSGIENPKNIIPLNK